MKPIFLKLSKPAGEIETGGSRFFGNPDLPQEYEYPTYVWADGEEYPYVFICQINLEEIAEFDKDNRLPHKGLLSFFAKIDRYLGCFEDEDSVSGYISEPEDVRVLYFPDTDGFEEFVLVDEDDEPMSAPELRIEFADKLEKYADEHALFAAPDHREWETWDPPYESMEILLQVDSCEGDDYMLNFMDCGVLDFLIDPEDLKAGRFDRVRAIVLST